MTWKQRAALLRKNYAATKNRDVDFYASADFHGRVELRGVITKMAHMYGDPDKLEQGGQTIAALMVREARKALEQA